MYTEKKEYGAVVRWEDAIMSERKSLLNKVNAYSFAAYDWNLYLDTHPGDAQAIAMFKKMVKKAEEAKAEYQQKFGPLTANDSMNAERWEWNDNPWPWDNL